MLTDEDLKKIDEIVENRTRGSGEGCVSLIIIILCLMILGTSCS